MDFVVHLPVFNNNTVIMVIVDRFSKAEHFVMLPTHFSAPKAAEVLTTTISKLHGYTRSIISDRDTIFLSSFRRTLFKLNGTKLCMSTAYHPRMDGQTEVVNHTLQQYLRVFVHKKVLHVTEDSYIGQSGSTILPPTVLRGTHLLISFMAADHLHPF